MPVADFSTAPVGTIPPGPFSYGGFRFAGSGLRIRTVLALTAHGLTFSSPDLRIELPAPACSVYLEVYVDNDMTIQALDQGGSVIPPVFTFPAAAGRQLVVLTAPTIDAIYSVRVIGGNDENLVIVVASP